MASRDSYGRLVTFDPVAFGRRVAAARVWRGLEPKQVAVALETSPETVNRWERGGITKPPAKGQLRLLAEVLEQDEAWLLRGETPPWHEPPGDNGGSASNGEPSLRDVLQKLEAIERRLEREFSRRRSEAR